MKKNVIWGECWHDSSLERIIIEYDKVVIEIEKDEKNVELTCVNYIGFQYLGQWDENIIKSIELRTDDVIIREAKKSIKDVSSLGGGIKQYATTWKCVVIELLDGVEIYIVCEEILYKEY